jgi:hypothetical protein
MGLAFLFALGGWTGLRVARLALEFTVPHSRLAGSGAHVASK